MYVRSEAMRKYVRSLKRLALIFFLLACEPVYWREGIGIRLDWADDRLWILIEPRTVFDGITDENRGAPLILLVNEL